MRQGCGFTLPPPNVMWALIYFPWESSNNLNVPASQLCQLSQLSQPSQPSPQPAQILASKAFGSLYGV